MNFSKHLLLLVCALIAISPAFSQSEGYTLMDNGSIAPSPRIDGTIAYDPGSRRIYLFGGQRAEALNDLWTYSFERRQWEQVDTPGERPSARFGHTLILDAPRNRLIVFGGQSSGFFSDVWAFGLGGGGWRRLGADDAGPSRRYGHSAIYDAARERMVISHGFTNAGRFDDTWAFDLRSDSWSNISPSGTRPLRRCLHHAVYDGERNLMYLYGGCASGFGPCPLGDFWAFDLTMNRWLERSGGAVPAPRQQYGMAFDTNRSRLLVFGGSGGALLNDTWQFDAALGQWREVRTQGPIPARRHRHQAAYASDRGTTFYFGGSLEAGARTNELWMFGPVFAASGPQVAREGVVNAFSQMGGSVAPGELISIYGSGLGPIDGISFQFDSTTGLLPRSGPGLQVSFSGVTAPLLYAGATQINAQVPYELAGIAEARLTVTVNGQSSGALPFVVEPAKPGLFQGIWNQNGSKNAPENPASVGEVVTLFATGQGLTSPVSVSGQRAEGPYPEPIAESRLLVDGQPAEILFRGQAPGTVGVMQINARIPAGISSGATVPVVVEIGAAPSQRGVTVAVR
ncbi:MAG: kelch repeat-containing protein [Bryobacteraceae bacterium]